MNKNKEKLPAHEVILKRLKEQETQVLSLSGQHPVAYLLLEKVSWELFDVLSSMKLPEKHIPEIAQRLRGLTGIVIGVDRLYDFIVELEAVPAPSEQPQEP